MLVWSLSAPLARKQQGIIAEYHFDEGAGDQIIDSTNNHNDGQILGGTIWTDGLHGSGLVFTGSNSVRIPTTKTLDHGGAISVSAWIRGTAAPFRQGAALTHFRPPHFQVCGDKIYLTTQNDYVDLSESLINGKKSFVSDVERPDALWTGIVDVNLTNWQYCATNGQWRVGAARQS